MDRTRLKVFFFRLNSIGFFLIFNFFYTLSLIGFFFIFNYHYNSRHIRFGIKYHEKRLLFYNIIHLIIFEVNNTFVFVQCVFEINKKSLVNRNPGAAGCPNGDIFGFIFQIPKPIGFIGLETNHVLNK